MSEESAKEAAIEPSLSQENIAAQAGERIIPFDSLKALAASHTELLGRAISGSGADQPGFLDDVREIVERGRATGARLGSITERRTAQSMLNYWVTVLYGAGLTETPDAILVPYVEPEKLDLETAKCPYVGLNPFTEADHEDFYGRSGITDRIMKKLTESGLMVLVGPAGSGKTSVINAAIVPGLKGGKTVPGSERWHYPNHIAPGREPLTSLASILPAPAGVSAEQVQQDAVELLKDTTYLSRRLTDKEFGGQPFLLVIDRFEEAFTLCKDAAQRDAFIANVINLIADSGPTVPKHRVILVIRSDRTNYIIGRDDLKDLYHKSEVRIYPLRESDLREAIKEPAEKIGLKFEPGVVNQLVREIYHDYGGLALLQFCLLRLWDEKDGDTVTWAALNRLESCQFALLSTTSDWYNDLNDAQRETARLVLLKMVRITDALEVIGDRARREDLHETAGGRERVDFVLEGLTKARLVRVTRCAGASDDAPNARDVSASASRNDQFQLVHETQWRDWNIFTTWLKGLREALVTRQRLEATAANWAVLGRKDIGLLDKYQLHEARIWMETRQAKELGYDADLRALVEKSSVALARYRFRKRLSIAISIALAVMVAGIFVYLGLKQRSGLKQATSRRLAETAGDIRNTQLDLSLLLSLESYDKDSDHSDALRSKLLESLAYSPHLSAYLQTPEKVGQLAFNSDGTRLSALSVEGGTYLWDVNSRLRIDKNDKSAGGSTSLIKAEENKLLLSHDGRLLVSTGDQDNELIIKDVETNQGIRTIPTSEKKTTGKPTALAFSHDDKLLTWLTPIESEGPQAGNPGMFELTLWDLVQHRRIAAVPLDVELRAIAFSPENVIATGTGEGDIVFRQVDDLKVKGRPLVAAFNPETINRLVFSGDGKSLASLDDAAELSVWSVADGKELAHIKSDEEESQVTAPDNSESQLEKTGPKITAFALNRTGSQLVVGYDDGTVVFWTVGNKAPDDKFPGKHGFQVAHIFFCSEDKGVITTARRGDDKETAGQSKSVLLWHADPKWKEVVLPIGAGSVRSVTVSPDTRTLAASIDAGAIVMFDLGEPDFGDALPPPGTDTTTGPDAPASAADATGALTNQTFTANGAKLLARYESNKIASFDVRQKTSQWIPINLTGTQSGSGSQIVDAVFSRNGEVLAARNLNNTVSFWNAETGASRGEIALGGERGNDPERGPIAISPDGSKLAAGKGTEIAFWDVNSRNRIGSVTEKAPVLSVAFDRTGDQVLAGTVDGLTTLWQVSGGEPRRLGAKKASRTSSVGFSPDGSTLVSVSDDGTIRMWDADGNAVSELQLNVTSFAFSPDSKTLGCVSGDSIIFWDLETLEEISTLPLGDRSSVISLAYAPDGRTVSVGFQDGTVLFLPLGMEHWRERACHIANRQLRKLERRKYRVLEDKALPKLLFWMDEAKFYGGTCPGAPAAD